MKEEVWKRKEDRDAEAKAEDDDKRKWMSTTQLWVDSRGSDADSEVNHPCFSSSCFTSQIWLASVLSPQISSAARRRGLLVFTHSPHISSAARRLQRRQKYLSSMRKVNMV